MSYQDVILNREKGWVEVTINRPEVKAAFT